MNDSGLLIVVSGPSGAGKGTICSALREQFPNIQYSISMTTRDPRPGEVDGVNYYFADNARFEQLLAEDASWNTPRSTTITTARPRSTSTRCWKKASMSCWKSTSREPCRSKNGIPRRLHLHRTAQPGCVGKTPPRPPDRFGRRHRRPPGQAREELDWIDRYDYVIVNDDLDKAVDEAASILKAEQCKVTRNAHRIAHTKELYK